MLVEEQVVSIWAGTRGHLDSVEIADVSRFESELLDWFRTRHGSILSEIRESGNIGDEEAFESAIAAFSDQFEATNPTQETPDAEFSETDSNIVDADTTLPEEDISGA